jgi:hypothetical protein
MASTAQSRTSPSTCLSRARIRVPPGRLPSCNKPPNTAHGRAQLEGDPFRPPASDKDIHKHQFRQRSCDLVRHASRTQGRKWICDLANESETLIGQRMTHSEQDRPEPCLGQVVRAVA